MLARPKIGKCLQLLGLLAAANAWAGPPSEVEALLSRGVELRREHRDAEALELFERANQLAPSPRATAQVALAEQALNRWLESEAHLTQAVRHADDPWVKKNRAALEEALRVIGLHLGWLQVDLEFPSAAPTEAQVMVNGRPYAWTPGAPAWRVLAGFVAVEVRAAGYRPAESSLQILPGETQRVALSLSLEPVIPSPQAPAAVTVSSGAQRNPLRTGLGWGALGVAAVGTGLAIGYGIVTLDRLAVRNKECDASGCSTAGLTAHREAVGPAWVSTVGLGVAVVGAAAGLFLLLFPSRTAPVTVAITGQSITLSGQF